MDRWLNRLAKISVVVIGVIVVSNLLNPTPRRSIGAPEFKKGEQIDTSKLGLSHPALLLITRSSCRYCTASMPFYASLNGSKIIAIASGEPVEANSKYLASHNVHPRKVLSLEEIGLTISATPILVLVDGKGKIQDSWRGQLDESTQRLVKKRIEDIRAD